MHQRSQHILCSINNNGLIAKAILQQSKEKFVESAQGDVACLNNFKRYKYEQGQTKNQVFVFIPVHAD